MKCDLIHNYNFTKERIELTSFLRKNTAGAQVVSQ